MKGNGDKLDALLFAPLPPVADGGFSDRVVARLPAMPERAAWREWVPVVVTALLLVAFLPVAQLSHSIESLSYGLGSSLPLAMAALAIALTGAFARTLAD